MRPASRRPSVNRDWPAPYVPASAVTFKVELASPDHAQHFDGRTSSTLVRPRTVVSRGQTFWQAWDQFWYRQWPPPGR
jgi:hypothetical protein